MNAHSPNFRYQCFRRGLSMPLDAVTAARVIPTVQNELAELDRHPGKTCTPASGDYTEWKNRTEDLQDFLAVLQELIAPPPQAPAHSHPTSNLPYGNSSPTEKTSITAPRPMAESGGVPSCDSLTATENSTTAPATTTLANSPANESHLIIKKQELSERAPQPQPLNGERASERHPSEGRATPEPDPNRTRATSSAQVSDTPATDATKDPSAAREAEIQEIQRDRAHYLAEIQRMRASRSPIDDLSPERRKLLFEMLEANDATIVCKLIAQSEPLGWNFQTHVSSLKRFHERYKRQLDQAERLRVIEEANQTIRELGPANALAVEAALNLLKLRFMDAVRSKHAGPQIIESYARVIDRHRRTDLAERKQLFAEKKLAAAKS